MLIVRNETYNTTVFEKIYLRRGRYDLVFYTISYKKKHGREIHGRDIFKRVN